MAALVGLAGAPAYAQQDPAPGPADTLLQVLSELGTDKDSQQRLSELRAEVEREIAESDPASAAYFNQRVAPLLQEYCVSCHEPGKDRGGLDLRTPAGIRRGGDAGAVIEAGNSAGSLMMKQIRHEAEPGMPYKDPKLPDSIIAVFERWIDAGAALPEVGIEAAIDDAEMRVGEADRRFWSFRPLASPEIPTPDRDDWARNEIDRFTLARMEEQGLQPSPEADRRTLIRRAYFDLLGLPPTPDAIDRFVNDPADDAYERLIDELLDSPHYGERWGRHWLDIARYAESGGYEFDVVRPNAYPYRDFVIQAFNQDMPFDRFVKWQLAGDEYAPDNPEAIAATGFLAAGPSITNQETEENFYNDMDDIASTTVSSFLGLTLACARCHDHKYDPIPTRDYYRLVSTFTTLERGDRYLATREEADAYREAKKAWDTDLRRAQRERDEFLNPFRDTVRNARIDALEIEKEERDLLKAPFNKDNDRQKKLREKYKSVLEVKDEDIQKGRTDEEIARWDELNAAVKAVDAKRPNEPPKVYAVHDKQDERVESYLLARGNPKSKTETIDLGFLSVLPGADSAEFAAANWKKDGVKSTFQRTALAEWLTDVDDGAGRLTLRVIANRMWHYHFGRGIVGTPNDFGIQGQRPTHPDLLEWISGQIARDDWKLKTMHRRIMTSSTYRQASNFSEANAAIDPSNTYLWRFKPMRIEAEIVRDSMMRVAGTLNTKMYGKPVYPFMHPDAIATGSTDKWPKDVVDSPDTWRRSIYVHIRRSVLVPMMESFDAPDATASCARRNTTTVPSQALTLMNSRFVTDQAEHFAKRIQEHTGGDPAAFVDAAFRNALGRAPKETELAQSVAFIDSQAKRHAAAGRDGQAEALIDFCQTVFALNEFVYVN